MAKTNRVHMIWLCFARKPGGAIHLTHEWNFDGICFPKHAYSATQIPSTILFDSNVADKSFWGFFSTFSILLPYRLTSYAESGCHFHAKSVKYRTNFSAAKMVDKQRPQSGKCCSAEILFNSGAIFFSFWRGAWIANWRDRMRRIASIDT